MGQLIISDIDAVLLQQLGDRAALHGRTIEGEAKSILTDAIGVPAANGWTAVDRIRDRLSVSGRAFSDSTEVLREDRQR